MTPKDILPLVQIVVTAVLTLTGLYFGPKIAVRHALEQFRHQKLLEKRIEIYQQLLQDMSHLYEYFGEQFMKAVTGTALGEFGPKVDEAKLALERHACGGGFIISEAAEEAIVNVLATMNCHDFKSVDEEFNQITEALKASLKVMKQCARKDCGL